MSTLVALTNMAYRSWTIFKRRNVRSSKYKPIADELELIEWKLKYAHEGLPDECQETVSNHNLALKKNHPVLVTYLYRSDDHTQLDGSAHAEKLRTLLLPPNKNQSQMNNKEYVRIISATVECKLRLLMCRFNLVVKLCEEKCGIYLSRYYSHICKTNF